MKINIGPYRSTWINRIHSDYMNKKYNYLWPDIEEWTLYERVLDKIEAIINNIYNYTINQILKRLNRKVKIHIDSFDVWSMDHTLALIVVPMLKLLKENKHGSPLVDDKDVPLELRSVSAPKLTKKQKQDGHLDNNHFKRWDWVISEMIYAFECITNDDWEEQFFSGNRDYKMVPFKEKGVSYYRMEQGPNHTFKVNRKAMDKAWKRRNNGLRLFAKYYHALWD